MDSVLRDLPLIKSDVISALLANPDICTILMDRKIVSDSGLVAADPDIDDEKLVYKNIWPYLYIDDTQTEAQSYICVESALSGMGSRTIKNIELTIWVQCHRDIMEYTHKGYLGTRIDILTDMVEQTLREHISNKRVGIGHFEIRSARHFFPHNKYYGRELILTVPEFNVKAGGL